jgi:hypothetical protein
MREKVDVVFLSEGKIASFDVVKKLVLNQIVTCCISCVKLVVIEVWSEQEADYLIEIYL